MQTTTVSTTTPASKEAAQANAPAAPAVQSRADPARESAQTIATTDAASSSPAVELWKDLAGPAESTFTILAILAAALWFFLRRQRLPHANVRHDIKYWHVGNRIVLHVIVTIANVGDVVLRLRSMKMRIQQLLPTPPDIRADILAARDPVQQGETEILWPDIATRECNWKWREVREIEPGETDEFHFDFALPPEIMAVEVYTHTSNRRKRFRRIGWNATSLCAFSEDVVFAREGVPIGGAPSGTGDEMSTKDRSTTQEVQKQGPAKTTSTEKRQGPEKTSTSTSTSGNQSNKK